jgi:16S rRNA (uracil1498-N3)-methyltransferase
MPNAFYGNLFNNKIVLDKDETTHIKIVRLNVNDEIKVFDGIGNIYYCKIEKIKKNETICEIIKSEYNNKVYKPIINFYMGASKFDRMKILIEKLVELRVNNIFIYHSEKSQLKFKSLEKFKKTVIESSKQSENPLFPNIDFVNYNEIFNTKNAILLDLKSNIILKNVLEEFDSPEEISVVLGPDMGFSENELNNIPNNIRKVNLGNTIMRFETAGIFTISILNYYYNRLHI